MFNQIVSTLECMEWNMISEITGGYNTPDTVVVRDIDDKSRS